MKNKLFNNFWEDLPMYATVLLFFSVMVLLFGQFDWKTRLMLKKEEKARMFDAQRAANPPTIKNKIYKLNHF